MSLSRMQIAALIAVLTLMTHTYVTSLGHTAGTTKKHIPLSLTATSRYEVTRVVDGDTIDVNVNGTIETVRLIGIDTPEVVDPRKAVQCFGKEASERARTILTGKSVFLQTDETQGLRDKYGRLLAYVILADDTDFNKKMIKDGYAHEYTYDIPYRHMDEYKVAQREARDANRGLWAPGVCSDQY